VEAMTMASRIAVINNGIVQQLDTPQNFMTRPPTCSWPDSWARRQ
jgi:ABC-type sugar transport system ATPase subunit